MMDNVKLPDFGAANILVVGDVMLDQYWSGECQRISPEAPVPVVKVSEQNQTAGGAGNAAVNLAALDAQTSLFGVIGQDQTGKVLESLLADHDISCYLQRACQSPTINKLRIMGGTQQLLRSDFESNFPEIYYEQLVQELAEHMRQAQAILFSDYGKGCKQIVSKLIQKAKVYGLPVTIDPKSNDFSIYQHATLITPNRKEFENVVGPWQDQAHLEQKAYRLMTENDIQALLVTQGSYGMTLMPREHPPVHLPTRAREVYDVTGAGDTVISVMTAALATGAGWEQAAHLANVAAGYVVGKIGTASVSPEDLRHALQEANSANYGVVDTETLAHYTKKVKDQGKTVVMTNGCFDLLHQGHVHFLEEAKKLGDRLIVAVNDDESVGRLKGHGRPIKNLEERMLLLSALRSVDWVVSFGEDTPKTLIEKITPSVLVKGGDYHDQEIAGADHVLAHGGQVKLLTYHSGHSTSSMIQTIQEH